MKEKLDYEKLMHLAACQMGIRWSLFLAVISIMAVEDAQSVVLGLNNPNTDHCEWAEEMFGLVYRSNQDELFEKLRQWEQDITIP